jgi:hypothetical protein
MFQIMDQPKVITAWNHKQINQNHLVHLHKEN